MAQDLFEDEDKKLNRQIASMSGGGGAYADIQKVDEEKRQTKTIGAKNIQSVKDTLAQVESELQNYRPSLETDQNLRDKIANIYKGYSPKESELPADDTSVWTQLAVSLGPALLGAALGRDALGRAMGVTAGAAAGKEYAEGLSRREEKRADVLKEINKRRAEMELKRLEKQADFEVELAKLGAKKGVEDPRYKSLLDERAALRKSLALEGIVPGVETTTTKEQKPPKIFVKQIMPGVTWSPNLPTAYQDSPDGQKMVTEARKVSSQYGDLISSISDYRSLLAKSGGKTVDPTTPLGQKLELKYRDLLMKTKEAYHLGVLNGGDLEQLQKILPISVLQIEDERSFLSRALDIYKNSNKLEVMEEFEKMAENSMARKLEPLGFVVRLPKIVKMTEQERRKYFDFQNSVTGAKK